MSNLSIKERPILFSGPMVRAILDGSKTQTRRIVANFQRPKADVSPEVSPNHLYSAIAQKHPRWGFCVFGETEQDCANALAESSCCPYGRVGDQLWVRETWMPDAPQDGTWADTQFYGCRMSPLTDIPERFRKPKHCIYRATWDFSELVGWKPSIHMPRWASRVQLEITGVRVESLHAISEQDARAEGVQNIRNEGVFWLDYTNPEGKSTDSYTAGSALGSFRSLWASINGAESWDANPWVWVIEFRRIKP